MHKYVDKSIATQCKGANKQLSITELLKLIVQNPEKHHMDTDMDPEALKNEPAEDETPPKLRTKHWNQMMHLH